MAPQPVLGFFEEEIFQHPDQRTVCIPSFFSLPKQLHGLNFSPLAIYHHDIAYHLLIESANPLRLVWLKFLWFLQQKARDPQAGISKIRLMVVSDREFPWIVTNKKNLSHAINFWLLLCACTQVCLIHEGQKSSDLGHPFLELFIEFYKKNRHELVDYGLTIQSIEEAFKDRFYKGYSLEDRYFLNRLEYLRRECPAS